MLRFVGLSHEIISIHTMGPQDDMLMWLMSEAKGVERSLDGLARRLLVVSFSGVHSTALVSVVTLLLVMIGS